MTEPLTKEEQDDLRKLKFGDPYPAWAGGSRLGVGDELAPRFMATIDVLEKALEPFAKVGKNISPSMSDQYAFKCPLDEQAATYKPPTGSTPDHRIPAISLLYVGDLRRAAAALKGK